LKEIVENVKIGIQNEKNENDQKISTIINKKEHIINQKCDKNEKISKNINNNILKVSIGDLLKRETLVTHKKNVSLNPKVFLNQEYKLNNLLINNKSTSENNKVKSNSIGKSVNNKVKSSNLSNSNISNLVPEKENKIIPGNSTVIPETKIPLKTNVMNNYIKNKSRSSSDSSVKFNHINELLSKQQSILQVPNPCLINYNPGIKKLEKKLNLPALNPTTEKYKTETITSSNNNRNLSHDIKSKNNLSSNLGNNKKSDLKKILNVNKNHLMNINLFSINNSNIESSYASVGNKSNYSGNSSKLSADKSKNQPLSQKTHAAVIPIPKIPNMKKNTSSKTMSLNSVNNNFVLNHEDMFKLFNKIKKLNVEENSSRNDSKSNWK